MLKKILFSLLTACASLSAAPQAIVFDFGGVQTTEPNRKAVIHFLCTSFNLSHEEFEVANQEKKTAIKLGKSDAEFWIQFAKNRNICLPVNWEEDFNAVLKNSIGVNPRMYALVEQLKEKGFQVAMLSNIDERLAKVIRGYGFYEPFNPCLLSFEIGYEKPDSKIYEVLLREMELPAGNIVFIDDLIENVEAAKKMGIDAILFVSQKQLQDELEKRGIDLGLVTKVN